MEHFIHLTSSLLTSPCPYSYASHYSHPPYYFLTHHIVVPLGFYPNNITIALAGPETVYPAPGVPFGLSFLGTAFSEMDLISFAFAYERKTQTRLGRRAFLEAIPKTQLVDVIGK